MSEKPSVFSELKRRNVYKVAVAYMVGGWALSQGIAQVLPVFDVPNWAIRLVVLLIIIGFPIALIIAWAFEVTPEGIKRTEAADAAGQRSRGVAWIYVVLIGAALSVSLFLPAGIRQATQRLDRARRLQPFPQSPSRCFHWSTKAVIRRTSTFRMDCRKN